MHAGAAVADLRPGHGRRAVVPAGRAGRPAHALRDVLIGLAIDIGAGAEALDRGVDDARVQFLEPLPRKTLAVEHARAEIFEDHVAAPDQILDDPPAARRFQIDRDAALVRVQHREVEAVGALHVLQLAAGNVAAPRHLDLDHIGAHPRQQLGRRRPRLDMAEIENAHTFECLAHRLPHLNANIVAPTLLSPHAGEGQEGVVSRKSPCSSTCAASPSACSRASRSARSGSRRSSAAMIAM